MSHFTVMLIGHKNVESALGPFNEQPEDGDPYVTLEFIDKTDEMREEYETQTTERVRMPDGRLLSPWDDELRVDPETKGAYFSGAFRVPEGAQKVEVPFKEVYPTFEAFVDGFHGTKPTLIDGELRYGYYDNPNAKWDWYEIGGRWAGFFKLKPTKSGKRGRDGVMGSHHSKDGVDIARKGDIDIEGMRTESGDRAGEFWDKVQPVIAGLPVVTPWEEYIKQVDAGTLDIDRAREAYGAQPAVKAFRESQLGGWTSKVEDYQLPNTREAYVQDARDSAITTFAFLTPEGEWVERGQMGFWGMAHNEQDRDVWAKKFNEYFDTLPDDTLLTVVDCHI